MMKEERAMAYQVERIGAMDEELAAGIERLISVERLRYRRLWAYYRNAMRVWAVDGSDAGATRPYRQAQEWGLPSRITGVRSGTEIGRAIDASGAARKEVVIENDIAWRVDTMVDYLFGKPLSIASAASDSARREKISKLIRLILARSGGILFLQQLAVIGSVYGFVDVVVKLVGGRTAGEKGAVSETADAPPLPSQCGEEGASEAGVQELGAPTGGDVAVDVDDAELRKLAGMIRLEIVEPARAVPILCEADWREIEG